MKFDNHKYGFRIVGDCRNERRLVNAQTAFAAHLANDPKAENDKECYLSAFNFAGCFKTWLDVHQSPKGFAGPCCSHFVWFDIDRSDDLPAAFNDAVKLVIAMEDNALAKPADCLVFFSGSKGFHVGISTALWTPDPAADFHHICKAFASRCAALAGIVIDMGVYDKVRAFRAPNSKHPKTGRHKVRLPPNFWELGLGGVLTLAEKPAPSEFDPPTGQCEAAAKLWADCKGEVEGVATVKANRRDCGPATALNQLTLSFICDGADSGDRHRLLYSAARNLGEFECSQRLAVALLTEAALDSGLSPTEVKRQIECGLKDAANRSNP